MHCDCTCCFPLSLSSSPNLPVVHTCFVIRFPSRIRQVLRALHPDAREKYSTTSSLRAVSEDPLLRDPRRRMFYQVGLCQPFEPMLAKKYGADGSDGVAAIGALRRGGPFLIEDKYDGRRLLLHKKGTEVG